MSCVIGCHRPFTVAAVNVVGFKGIVVDEIVDDLADLCDCPSRAERFEHCFGSDGLQLNWIYGDRSCPHFFIILSLFPGQIIRLW